jgi:predicted PurR-regulated permease PerM
MSSEQANEFLVDYGPVIWFVFLTVVFLAAIVKAWPFISSVVKTVEIITELPERFDHIYNKLDTLEIRLISVEHEVKTNGGSSIKDAVKRIEERLDNI